MDKAELMESAQAKLKAAEDTFTSVSRLITLLPEEIDCIHFIDNESIYLHTVDTLEELLAQVAQFEQFKPEMLSYNVTYNCWFTCKFVTSLGFMLTAFCTTIEPALAHFSEGKCVVETTTTKTKSLKCVRD